MIRLKGFSALVIPLVLACGCKPAPEVASPLGNGKKNASQFKPSVVETPGATGPSAVPEVSTRIAEGPMRSTGHFAPPGTRMMSNRGMQNPGMMEYRRPAPPPTDQVVNNEYRLPSGSRAYIEGICRVSEASVECWSPEGKADKPLAERVEASIKSRSFENVPMRYGKKNRLVIAREEQVQNYTSGANLQVNGVRGYDLVGTIYFQDAASRQKPGDPMVTERGFYVATEPGIRTASLEATTTESLPGTAELGCKVGATATLGDLKLKVVKISKEDQAYPPGYPMRDGWILRVSVENSSKVHWRLGASAMFADGKPLYAVDLKGNPLTMEKMMEINRQESEARMKAMNSGKPGRGPQSFTPIRPKTQPVNIMAREEGSGYVNLAMTVNPTKVPKLRLNAYRNKVIEITGVRLDP